MSRRRSAFSGEGEKRKVVVGGEKKGEGERERNCTVFLDGARNILASSFLFEKEKKKKRKNSSSSFLPSFFNSREE